MPLHLLSKKSWNVYNPAAIARVRADEAAAAAQEEAYDQRLQEYEAAKRLALLRGEEPPACPPPAPPTEPEQGHVRPADGGREKREMGSSMGEERRKRRKLAGEDDTDRDIRVARVREEERKARRDDVSAASAGGHRKGKEEVPIVDHTGHIQLFAPPSTREIRAEKEAEGKSGKKGKEEEGDDAGALRFKDAAGFKNRIDRKPWYAVAGSGSGYSGTEELEQPGGRDAFGNEDAGRGKRDSARLSAADPMAVMARAQTKIREVERGREVSRRERERELEELKQMQRWEAKKGRHQRDDEDSLDGFRLDTSRDQREARHETSSRRDTHRSRKDGSRGGDRRDDDRRRHSKNGRPRHSHSHRHRER